LTEEVVSATSPPELANTEVQSPATVAEEQKTEIPAPGAEEQKLEEVAETPEQQAAKQESRRQKAARRAAADLAAARTEARIYREQLEAKEAKQAVSTEQPEPRREDFPDDYQYIRAVNAYDTKKMLDAEKAERKATEGKQAQSRQSEASEKIAKAWEDREKSFAATAKDYHEVVGEFAEEGLHKLSMQFRTAIVESEAGPALLHYLAKNEEVADRIAALSPTRQIIELGKLEDKVSKPATRTTNAPAPTRPVSASSGGNKDIAKMSPMEFRAWSKGKGVRWAQG